MAILNHSAAPRPNLYLAYLRGNPRKKTCLIETSNKAEEKKSIEKIASSGERKRKTNISNTKGDRPRYAERRGIWIGKVFLALKSRGITTSSNQYPLRLSIVKSTERERFKIEDQKKYSKKRMRTFCIMDQ